MYLFSKAIRQLLNFDTMPYSVYLAFGIMLSLGAQLYVYHRAGASDMATWFSQFGIAKSPSTLLAAEMSIAYSIILLLALQISLPFILKLPLEKVFTLSIVLSVSICIISNLIISSIMRLPYELIFCLIPFLAIISKQCYQGSSVSELTNALKFIIPLCIGLPIVMGGSGFIAAFYQRQQNIVQIQLYRHVIVSTYFIFGAVLFFVYPFVRQILLLKQRVP